MSFRHLVSPRFGRHFFSSLFRTGPAPGRRPDEARGRILSALAVFFLLFFFLSAPAEAAPGAPSASGAVSVPAFPAPSASPETPALPERAVSLVHGYLIASSAEGCRLKFRYYSSAA